VRASASEEPTFSLVRKMSALDKPPPSLAANVFYGQPLKRLYMVDDT